MSCTTCKGKGRLRVAKPGRSRTGRKRHRLVRCRDCGGKNWKRK